MGLGDGEKDAEKSATRLETYINELSQLTEEEDLWCSITQILRLEFGIDTVMFAFAHSVHALSRSRMSSHFFIKHNVPSDSLFAHDGLNLEDDCVFPRIVRGEPKILWSDIDMGTLELNQVRRLAIDERLGFGAGLSVGGRFGGGLGAYCMCMSARHQCEVEFSSFIRSRINEIQILVAKFECLMRPVMVAKRWNLTPKQKQVIALSIAGHTAKVIAAQLGMSPRSIEHLLARARRSLNSETTLEAVAKAVIYELVG